MKNFKLLQGFTNKTRRNRINNEIRIPNFNESLPVQYEPMIVNRFLVIFPESFNISSWFVRSVNRPSMRVGPHGRREWDDFEITLYDPITPSTSQYIFELIDSDLITQQMTFTIQMLSPVGDVVSEWRIFGRISSIDYGTLDYGDNSPTKIKMTIRPDYVLLNF